MNHKGKLLLVDGEPTIQENNKMVLERRGYSTRQAYTLAEARTILADEPADAVILDIRLSDGGAIPFLHELRKNSNVPVLVMTNIDTPKEVLQGIEAVGGSYLAKPYRLDDLLDSTEALMQRALQNKRGSPQ